MAFFPFHSPAHPQTLLQVGFDPNQHSEARGLTCLEAAARHGCASCLALLCDAGAEPLAGPILHAQPRKTALMHAAGAFPVTTMRLSHKSTKQCKGTWQLWSCSAGGTLPASMRCARATLHSIWQQRRASCRSWMSCCSTVRHVVLHL